MFHSKPWKTSRKPKNSWCWLGLLTLEDADSNTTVVDLTFQKYGRSSDCAAASKPTHMYPQSDSKKWLWGMFIYTYVYSNSGPGNCLQEWKRPGLPVANRSTFGQKFPLCVHRNKFGYLLLLPFYTKNQSHVRSLPVPQLVTVSWISGGYSNAIIDK